MVREIVALRCGLFYPRCRAVFSPFLCRSPAAREDQETSDEVATLVSQAPLELPLGLEARLMVLLPRAASLVRSAMEVEEEDTGEAMLLRREAEEVCLCVPGGTSLTMAPRRWRRRN